MFFRVITCYRCGARISSNGLAQASHRNSWVCDRRRANSIMRPLGWTRTSGNNYRGLPAFLRPVVGGVRWIPVELAGIFEQLEEWETRDEIYKMIREPEVMEHWKAWAAAHTP
jgi:hypothetical protein